MMPDTQRTDSSYPPLSAYALIGDYHSAALVSRSGAIDWCCLPRLDSEACFSRLLDWEKGGYFSITPEASQYTVARKYLDNTLVLETRFSTPTGSCRLFDCFAMREGGKDEPQHFTHSKVRCWRALDCGIRLATTLQRSCPLDRWRQVRDEIRAAVETHGYDRQRGVFVQAFGSTALDASLLLLPSVEFISPCDLRMLRTVNAIQADLSENGLLVRYRTDDCLQGTAGVFLCCTFWLVECLAQQGRKAEARVLFDRAVSLANDVGLFAEEYDVYTNEMLGNFPQGLTHLSHIIAAVSLAR